MNDDLRKDIEEAFDAAVQQRETWYGRDGRPSLGATAALEEGAP